MFKRLRNNFLLLNIIIIFILLIVAFSVVYAFTYNNTMNSVERRISQTLMRSEPRFEKFGQPTADNEHIPHPEDTDFMSQDNGKHIPKEPQDLSTSFTLKLNESGEITEVNSIFEVDDDLYQTAIEKITAENSINNILNSDINSINGKVKFEDSVWRYKTEKVSGQLKIALMDITAEMNMLKTLILTFSLVALLALFIIFLISLAFANRAIKPIEEAWNKQNDFIADASHELKTPLTTINTNIDVVLSDKNKTVREQQKWLIYIKDEASRMSRLIGDLLSLTQLEWPNNSGRLGCGNEFSFSDTLDSVILGMEAVVFEKGLSLISDIQPDISIKGDKDLIKQLIMILLDNAIKYSDKNGEIKVTLKKEKKIKLSVSNRCPEMTIEDAEHIFDRFYRADKSRNRSSGGYGLGLSIAKSIVQKHNGNISVYSKNNLTVFTVEI